jgi:hypothetical protein
MLQASYGNPNYGDAYTLRSAGLTPTGDPAKDMRAAMGVIGQRQLLLDQFKDPLIVQNMLDAANRGTDVFQRARSVGAEGDYTNRYFRGDKLPSDALSLAGYADLLEPVRPQPMAEGGTVSTMPQRELPELPPLGPAQPSLQNDIGPLGPSSNILPPGAIEGPEGNPIYPRDINPNYQGPRLDNPWTYDLWANRRRLDPFTVARQRNYTLPTPQDFDLRGDRAQRLPDWRTAQNTDAFAQAWARALRDLGLPSGYAHPFFRTGGWGGASSTFGMNIGGQMSVLPDQMPAYATGTQMMTNEPIVGMGMQSQQPKFMVGEPQVPGGPPAPEVLTVTPTQGPNAGMPPPPALPPPSNFQLLMQNLLSTRGNQGKNRVRPLAPVGAASGGGY